jgi:type II secretory ATPase GspE/PulE/Tfp pilus assembly ATPase PilB-like protein
MLNQPGVKIITTEDPVEFQIDRLIQCNVNDDVGLTFARCLRSILRQDPDIVMVGEIRDLETAQIAVEASLTGHLVLSTLHTNSAPETITRLLDMDVEPFLIAASLEAVLAQRLCRKVCRFCKESYVPDDKEMDELGVPQAWRRDSKFKLVRAKGCVNCDYVGYNGRTGLYEMVSVDEGIRDLVLDSATALQLRRYCRKHLGMITLREAALMKAVQGVTTAAEVLYHTDAYED